MKLITETTFNDVKAVQRVDEATGDKEVFIEGIFAQAELKNRNGRVYPQAVLEREVNKYINEQVLTGRAMGELNHPNYPKVDPAKASHRIVEMHKDGSNFIGKALILNTNQGKHVKALLEGGCQLGVSTRGLGTVSEGGTVNDDFMLNTVDIVADPSGIDCWVNGIYEGAEWVYEGGALVEHVVEQFKAEVKHKFDEAKAVAAFDKWLKTL